MLQSTAALLRPLLESDAIRRIRRNHGLEHATIHVLNRQRYTLSGSSSASGFILLGDVPTDKVEAAVREALRRFHRGEAHWAIHPNCGTNLVASGVLAALVGALGFMGTTPRGAWSRFPIVVLAMMFTSFYSLPFGMALQKHFTTSGDMGDLEFVSLTRREMRVLGRVLVFHHVLTRKG